MKLAEYDAQKRISELNTRFASQSNLRQRIGRAGRVQCGEYYSLLSKSRVARFPYSHVPELLRKDLQSTILLLKSMNVGFVKPFLTRAIEPPRIENISAAISDLHSLGALTIDENRTILGKILSDLSVDPWIGKLLIHGVMFKCLDPILTIAALFNEKSIFFLGSPETRGRTRAEIQKTFGSSLCDELTALTAFNESRRNGFNQAYNYANNISYTVVSKVLKCRKQLLEQLQKKGVLSNSHGSFDGGPNLNVNSSNESLIVALLNSAFYPNISECIDTHRYYKSISRVGKLPERLQLSSLKLIKRNGEDISQIPRYLCFQEKASLDGRMVMRNVSVCNFYALAVLTNSSFNRVGNHYCLDGWIQLDRDENQVKGLLKIREALSICMENVMSGKQNENDEILIDYVVNLLGHNPPAYLDV